VNKFLLLISSAGGSLILTNIYLLVGVSLPLWIWPHPFTSRPPLPLYAGAVKMLWFRIRNLLVWSDLGPEKTSLDLTSRPIETFLI
jgi:hypothetical protein